MRDKLPGDIEWPEGELPEIGDYYLVADGLASRSLPDPKAISPYVPWLPILKRELSHPTFKDRARGFSYYKKRLHYARSHTNVTIEETPGWAASCTTSYMPDDKAIVTYIAFSLAGLIFTLGIGSFLGSGQIKEGSIKEVILVQPALKLTQKALKAL
ncbi:MAG TPA: hypothetical protein VGE04_04695, partial [Chloroflexia bacterium]